MEEYEKIYIRQEFIDDCLQGNLPNVRNLLLEIYHNPITEKSKLPDCETNASLGFLRSSININNRFSEYYDRALLWACSNNHLSLVKYLLTNEDFPKCANVHYSNSACFKAACKKGHLEIIRYLLTSGEVKDKPKIDEDNYEGFLSACRNCHIDVVEYLTKSPELYHKIDIEKVKNAGFKEACRTGNLTMIDYFVNNPDPQYRVKVHIDNDIGFKLAYRNGDLQTIQFLILNCGLQPSKYVNQQLYLKKKRKEHLNGDIIKIFDIQLLYEKTDALVNNKQEKNKFKI